MRFRTVGHYNSNLPGLLIGGCMDTLASRVTELREALGWTKEKLADEAGTSASYISRLEAGDFKRPSGVMLSKIARALRVPVQTLVHAGELRQRAGRLRPRSPREIIRELETSMPILVEEAGQSVSAGRGTAAEAELWPYYPTPGERNHEFTAIPVSGTCMEPTIPQGARVIVDKTMSPRPEQIVVAEHEGEYLVKKLERRNGELYLVAVQGQAPIRVTESTRIVGVVVYWGMKP